MKLVDKIIPIILILASLIMVGSSVYIASERDLTSLENALLQAFSLALGLIGSFQFGKQSAKDAAKELIKPHARSAFRRLISLYESLSRVGYVIEETSDAYDSSITMGKLQAIVIEQLATADDAIEDWNDIVPEEVAELKDKWKGSDNHVK
jgi:hypothetical protein